MSVFIYLGQDGLNAFLTVTLMQYNFKAKDAKSEWKHEL